uniref:SNARE-associated protein Snapin isoform X1 n=1 Tax=Jaculus jaculus TaxID=51337 RepID=UPI001E1B4257|nr:SNARE-associated protein Snapin isoform X1 [Jaculus jaculus]
MAGLSSAAVSGPGTPVAGPTGRDLFAEGLLEFLRPAVQQLDTHVHAVRESQVELREHIDNLATELCRINEDQKVALDLDPYVKKLLNARRRVVLVNNILQNAQVFFVVVFRGKAAEIKPQCCQGNSPEASNAGFRSLSFWFSKQVTWGL